METENSKQQKLQDKFDDWIVEVAQIIKDKKAMSFPALMSLLTTEHKYLQDWFLRKKDVKEVAGMLWLKAITK